MRSVGWSESFTPTGVLRAVMAFCGGSALIVSPALAFQIDMDSDNLNVRWDNTVKYSAAQRLKDASTALSADPASPFAAGFNNDDGNRNFKKGLISTRFDLLSELDVVYQQKLGFRISAAAWRDAAYGRSNDNPGPAGGAFPNQTSVPYNQFTKATRDLHGSDAEVLDAFVFGKFDLDGRTATVRAGRHSLVWGESLFLGGNAIAGGQMPVDVVKLISVPGTQFKEAIRPVPMLSGQLQVGPNVSVGAYLQTHSSKNRLPAVGSYFSNADYAIDGGENMYVPTGYASRLPDKNAKNEGQGGVQIKIRGDDVDYGFYAMQFHNKTPQIVPGFSPASFALMPAVGPFPTNYYIGYHENIRALAASVSKTFGDYNVAAELSFRSNQDLASTMGVDMSALGAPATNNSTNPAYAVGRTAHLNISMIGNVPSTPLWKEATIAAELAWNRVLSVTANENALDPNGTREGIAIRALFEPMYRQVLPGVDISVPIGIGYAPKGSRPLAVTPNSWLPDGGGDISLGLNATYRDAWRFGINYTHYFGTAKTFNVGPQSNFGWGQTFKDRDFVSVSARYSF